MAHKKDLEALDVSPFWKETPSLWEKIWYTYIEAFVNRVFHLKDNMKVRSIRPDV